MDATAPLGAPPDRAETPSPPAITLEDLTIIEAWDPVNNAANYTTFYTIGPDESVYFGESPKAKQNITLREYAEALRPVKDDEIYPLIPAGNQIRSAPQNVNEAAVFVKRPGLNCYETMRGTDYIPKVLLNEALVMEKISQEPHPNIVGYLGCRTKSGRITAIVLERYAQTLTQVALRSPYCLQQDEFGFFSCLESAVAHIHALGLAHNDINPDNIMFKGGPDGTGIGSPILIDFGSCKPAGEPLESLGTPGWYKEEFFTSEQEHHMYSLAQLRKWFQDKKGDCEL
ncbi:kinase-like domain-containing protein [Microdochium bolleyi]|uniref:Kinase-like domain-containing protein n=1 Tax=Microdochium bolleyi TaxID=196109 RepID=A0A136JD68_9PEZI|nr:kinase-like domain-containing protein [Microdochium bolleyi]